MIRKFLNGDRSLASADIDQCLFLVRSSVSPKGQRIIDKISARHQLCWNEPEKRDDFLRDDLDLLWPEVYP